MSLLSNIRFLFMSAKERAEYVRQQIEEIAVDRGASVDEGDFCYQPNGFFLKNLVSKKFYLWQEIEEITAYKADLITVDDLRLEISFSETVLTVSEDIPGWSHFIDVLMKKFPSIAVNWEAKVIAPPFAANPTIFFKR